MTVIPFGIKIAIIAIQWYIASYLEDPASQGGIKMDLSSRLESDMDVAAVNAFLPWYTLHHPRVI